MRVLLADDQAWLRSAMRLLLEEEPDVEIVGEVAEARTLLERLTNANADLLLLDWELPGIKSIGSGRQVMNALRACCPNLLVVVLSGRPEASSVALDAGADRFVSKADPPESLLAALHAVRTGGQP
ncbi:MAG: response regulator transcription factor [Caldilineaceae bacterium]|nr:response regulator transcription factor [Caldilineaceae bacterium]